MIVCRIAGEIREDGKRIQVWARGQMVGKNFAVRRGVEPTKLMEMLKVSGGEKIERGDMWAIWA